MNVVLPRVRLAFPKIFKAEQFKGQGDPAYSAALILDPHTPDGRKCIEDVKKAMIAVAKETWGAKYEAVLKSIKDTDKVCLRSGDSKAETAGFPGMMFVSTRNKADSPPTILDKDNETRLTAADGRPYGGCHVHASINIWAQDNGYGKRINASLRGLRFWKDGDAFSGSAPLDASEFDGINDFGEGESNTADDLL